MIGDIEKIFINAFEQPTQQLKKQQLNTAIKSIEKLKDEIDKIQETLLFYENQKKRLISLGLSKNAASYYMLNVEHLDISQTYQENLLQQKALEGYELVQNIRKKLTNESITYQIGVGSKTREKLLETSMTYDELVPFLYLEKRADTYAIRIKLSQRKLQQLNKERKVKLQIQADTIDIFTQGASTLYSKIYRYFTNTRLTKKGNWGNFYEVYRKLVKESPQGNNWNPSNIIIANAFKSVLAGSGIGGSFATGGDQGLEQDKASFGNNPTLTSVITIINTLDSLVISLQDFINNGNEKGLIKLFTGQDIENTVVDMAKEEAVIEIRKQLQKFLTN